MQLVGMPPNLPFLLWSCCFLFGLAMTKRPENCMLRFASLGVCQLLGGEPHFWLPNQGPVMFWLSCADKNPVAFDIFLLDKVSKGTSYTMLHLQHGPMLTFWCFERLLLFHFHPPKFGRFPESTNIFLRFVLNNKLVQYNFGKHLYRFLVVYIIHPWGCLTPQPVSVKSATFKRWTVYS